MLILIASALLPSGASGENKKHQNQTHPHSYHANAQPKPTSTPFTIIVQPAPVTIIQPSPAVEQNKPKQKWYERPTVTDWGVLFVTLLYVGVSIGLLKATQRQAESADRTFKATQRAEVTLGRPDGTLAEIIEPSVGEPLRVKIFLTNSGRTAARNFRAKEVIGIGDQPSTMDLGPEPVRHVRVQGGFTAQTGPITSTIASGGVFTRIARSAESLTEEDTDKIRARRLWIRIMGQYEYDDGVGSPDEWRAYYLDFDPTIGIFVATDSPLRRESWNF